MLSALSGTLLRPAIFVNATFVSGPIYIWSGLGTVMWNSQSWTGLGSLLGITTPEDGSAVEARGITISLSGLDPTLLPTRLHDFGLGLPVNVYLGLYDDTNTLINWPVTTWTGRMDQPTIEVGGGTCTININCENTLIDMNVSVARRYTNEDTQLFAPGDLGCSFVDSIQEVTLYWGGTPLNSNNV